MFKNRIKDFIGDKDKRDSRHKLEICAWIQISLKDKNIYENTLDSYEIETSRKKVDIFLVSNPTSSKPKECKLYWNNKR